jgi:phospholipid-binding lipoprotein MlaA
MRARLVPALAVLLSLIGLPARADIDHDPLERFNRAMFGFNRALVFEVIDPATRMIRPLLSDDALRHLATAYSNLTEVEFMLTNLFVGDVRSAAHSVARFAVNSTLGIAGLYDIASRLGIERREVEFGESLCHAGIPPGSYLVLPLVGPTNTSSAAVIGGAVFAHTYVFYIVSPAFAALEFVVVDLGGTAAALRYATETPGRSYDPYVVQRQEYSAYIGEGCG